MLAKHWSALAAAIVLIAGCQTAKEPSRATLTSKKPTPTDLKFETTADPPFKAKTHFAAGQLAESQGDANRAIQQYWAAVKLDPKYKEPLFRLGVLYCQLKDYRDASVAWKQYLKATDDDATGYSNLGFCQELSGHHDEAEASYRKGIAKDPQNGPCHVNYGLMLARDNRRAEAIIQLQAVLSPAQVHYNLAAVLEQQGETETARAEYHKALELDPKLTDAQVRLDVLK